MMNPFKHFTYFNIGIIEDSVESCLTNFEDLFKKGLITVEQSQKLDFTSVCSNPSLEYNPEERRFLIYEPLSNPNKTVFFPNIKDGWYTALYNYTRLFNKNSYLLGFTVNNKEQDPAYSFRHFKSTENEVRERVVYLIKEDNWKFYQHSTPLEIEETGNYIKRRKTDRLNNEIISSYMKKAGYDLATEDFYKSNKLTYLIKYK
jgi:hypothetical protein